MHRRSKPFFWELYASLVRAWGCGASQRNQKWGLGCSPAQRANKEARLMEKESLLYLGCWQLRGGRVDTCPKADSPDLTIRRRGLHEETAVSSDSHLDIGRLWSDQCHLDCFKCNSSSAWFSLLEAGSWNCDCLCHDCSLAIT